jgi:hypothetical protein
MLARVNFRVSSRWLKYPARLGIKVTVAAVISAGR